MESGNILIIEDDYIVARTIERSLRGAAFQIRQAANGQDGLRAARQQPPDLVILDVMMPGMDGYTVCRTMRADPQLQNIPILFLTARIKKEDRLAGFKAGADDYLCKPFNIDELMLRVQAILRRTRGLGTGPLSEAALARPASQAAPASGKTTPARVKPGPTRETPPIPSFGNETAARTEMSVEDRHCLRVGCFMLDTRSYVLHTPQGRVLLTPVQFHLLYHLMVHTGEIFTPARLLDELWDYPTEKGSPDLVRVHIKTLRQRIEPDPRAPIFLVTVPGRGYTINPNCA